MPDSIKSIEQFVGSVHGQLDMDLVVRRRCAAFVQMQQVSPISRWAALLILFSFTSDSPVRSFFLASAWIWSYFHALLYDQLPTRSDQMKVMMVAIWRSWNLGRLLYPSWRPVPTASYLSKMSWRLCLSLSRIRKWTPNRIWRHHTKLPITGLNKTRETVVIFFLNRSWGPLAPIGSGNTSWSQL